MLILFVNIFALHFVGKSSMFRLAEQLQQEQKRQAPPRTGKERSEAAEAARRGGTAGAPPAASASSNSSLCRASRSRNYAGASSLPKVAIENQRQLASGGYNKIAKGSGVVTAAGLVLNLLSRLQHASGLYGSVGELGVHHGRFTSLLFVTARATESLVAADLFQEHQDQNVDLSGRGDYGMFVRGLRSYGLDEADVAIIHRGSTADLPQDWSHRAGFAPFRLVSVDASHTAEFTRHDLSLVFCNLLEGGVVVLDDWFHAGWPGVVEGYFQFAAEQQQQQQEQRHPSGAFPFLFCEKKLYVTNSLEWHSRFYRLLLREEPVLASLLSPHSVEKERGSVLYEMGGVPYLKCTTRNNMTESFLQEQWAERVY